MNALPSLLCALAFAATALRSQCQLAWTPGYGIPGTNGGVHAATLWDPDGAGPQPERILLAGTFQVGGDVRGGVVSFEPAQRVWQSFGGEADGQITSVTALPNGDLVVTGLFQSIDGVVADRIARFDGVSWSELGGGLDGGGTHVVTLTNGDVVVAGWFTQAGGVTAPGIARWNGTAWSSPASSVQGQITALVPLANGELIAAGDFTAIDGVLAAGIARFDGVAWTALATSLTLQPTSGPGPVPGRIDLLLRLAGGDLLAFGRFDDIDGVATSNAARFDGQSWSAFGAGTTPHGLASAAERANGDVIATGPWLNANGDMEVRRFDGSSWLPLGTGMTGPLTSQVQCRRLIATTADDLLVFGRFVAADGQAASNAARWDGAAWTALTPGIDAPVFAFATHANGDLLAGGSFLTVDGVAARGVARFDGQTWSALGGGVDGTGVVIDIAAAPNGDVYVTGSFSSLGGTTARKVAHWNGTNWQPMSSGINGAGSSGSSLAVLPNGDVVLGGAFPQVGGVPANQIARWDGASWHPLGGGVNFLVSALVTMPNGDLIAGGGFTLAGNTPVSYVARWDGSTWHALGAGLPTDVGALAVSPAGELHAAYGHSATGGVARWDGAAWHMLGGGAAFDRSVEALHFLPDGSLVAGGAFEHVAGQPTFGIARWDGTAWRPQPGPAVGLREVEAIAHTANGDLLVGGGFLSGGATGNSYFARLEPACRATAAVVGAGCVGAAGPVSLEAEQLPWLGGSYRGLASGAPTGSLAVAIFGLGAQQTPLATLSPLGLPGCDLLVTPEVLQLSVPSGGLAQADWTLPVAPALVGQTFRQQFVLVELAGQITGLAASNALLLTIGAY
ncbi:MAG: hypothetical protein KAI24_18780 [Planctomycetes bacterium]|nr:hypothetical protein [Planctomycetota bacterium]